MEDKLKQLKLKVADLEEARHNNIKFRGIPENIKKADLKQFLYQIILDLFPTVPHQELVIDIAHRLSNPSYLPEKLPCDLIA